MWGVGCLLFAPCENITNNNLKCRFLPRLERQSISTNNLKKCSDTISKTYVNHLIVNGVISWRDLQHYTDEDKQYLPLIRFLSFRRMLDAGMTIHTDEINNEVLHFIKNKTKVGEMLRKLETAGLIAYKISGKRRLRSWTVMEDCSYQY